jgi:hypothetical protein
MGGQLRGDGAALRECLRLGLQIRHVDRSPFQHATPADRAAHGGRHIAYRHKNRAVVGDHRQAVALEAENRHVIGAT